MNKSLLFNGCSFTAGDFFCIVDFLKLKEKFSLAFEIENDSNFWNTGKIPISDLDFYEYHNHFKRQFNLPMQCANMLKTTVIDLSIDGNNNQNIALDTIAYLEERTKEEKENFHVVIGWTEPSRFLKYMESFNAYELISIHSANFKKFKKYDKLFEEYFKHFNDYDFLLTYNSAILLLESYLIAHDISYTFFQGVLFNAFNSIVKENEQVNYNVETTDELLIKKSSEIRNRLRMHKVLNFLDRSKWFVFNDLEVESITQSTIHPGIAWNYVISKENLINGHPNCDEINKMAKRLVKFIKL